jgi:hypothetical protein
LIVFARNHRPLNVLVLYDKYATFTNTVFDHLHALSRHSHHNHAFCHAVDNTPAIPWHEYDAVVIHYSVRVALDFLSPGLATRIARFGGVKILFVQDEYDYTDKTKATITELGLDIVYSCVPSASRAHVYPPEDFAGVEFVETLTGYVPELPCDDSTRTPIANRSIVVGYRGRALPYWYGDLGQEKRVIAEVVKAACQERSIAHDIEWDDTHRIYGPEWTAFLSSCKATLGTESGANLFDPDGSLRESFTAYLAAHPDASYAQARHAVVGDAPEHPIMNQVSPRIFEAIACGTALVLFEGNYSGVVRPGEHFLALRKDFSNLDEVLGKLADDDLLQSMVRRAYVDVVESGRYTFSAFVEQYDDRLENRLAARQTSATANITVSLSITRHPLRAAAPPGWLKNLWLAAPDRLRQCVKPAAHRLWWLLSAR